jgi:predicted metallopeptidase
MRSEKAPDVQVRMDGIIAKTGLKHVVAPRIICMRSYGAKANAYARIWSLPAIWREALGINPFYVIEVLSEKYDSLPEERKIRVLIHELMHIPKKFSGGLVPHTHPGGRIDARSVEKIYKEYAEDGMLR